MNKFEQKVQQMKDKYKIPNNKWEEFFSDTGDLLALALETTRPYLAETDRKVNKAISECNGRGQLQVNYNFYDYKVDYAVFTVVTKYKFDQTNP